MSFFLSYEHDGSLSIESAIAQAVGFGSMCWDNMSSTGVFHSDEAKEAVDVTTKFVLDSIKRPWLGLATTRELLAELESRMRITAEPTTPASRGQVVRLERVCRDALDLLDEGVLSYRTVDS